MLFPTAAAEAFQNPDPRNSACTALPARIPSPTIPAAKAEGTGCPFLGPFPEAASGRFRNQGLKLPTSLSLANLGAVGGRGGKDQALSPLSSRGCPAPPDTALAELRAQALRDGPHPARVALLFDRLLVFPLPRHGWGLTAKGFGRARVFETPRPLKMPWEELQKWEKQTKKGRSPRAKGQWKGRKPRSPLTSLQP